MLWIKLEKLKSKDVIEETSEEIRERGPCHGCFERDVWVLFHCDNILIMTYKSIIKLEWKIKSENPSFQTNTTEAL